MPDHVYWVKFQAGRDWKAYDMKNDLFLVPWLSKNVDYLVTITVQGVLKTEAKKTFEK